MERQVKGLCQLSCAAALFRISSALERSSGDRRSDGSSESLIVPRKRNKPRRPLAPACSMNRLQAAEILCCAGSLILKTSKAYAQQLPVDPTRRATLQSWVRGRRCCHRHPQLRPALVPRLAQTGATQLLTNQLFGHPTLEKNRLGLPRHKQSVSGNLARLTELIQQGLGIRIGGR